MRLGVGAEGFWGLGLNSVAVFALCFVHGHLISDLGAVIVTVVTVSSITSVR